jgi:molecular chaperone DnaK (HSP70)
MLAFTCFWIITTCDDGTRPISNVGDIDPTFCQLFHVIEPVNKPVIGIDFGTSFSRAAVFVDGKPETVYDERGEWNHPSVVRFEEARVSEGGRALGIVGVKGLLCGDGPLSHGVPAGVFRANETDGESEVGNMESRDASVADMISFVFERLKRLGEEQLGERIEHTVISVPSSFEEVEREAISEAAGKAGLKVLHLLNEGTAAALWSFRKRKDDILSVVFHVGGGTFDISVVWLRKTYYEVVGSDWKRGIGGLSMDDRIVDHLLSAFQSRTGKDASADFRAVERLRQASEAAKQALSEANETDIDLEDFFDGESLRERLTRSCFEDLISDLLSVMVDTTKRVLDGCLDFRGDPEHLIFSGGSTRIPKLEELICGLFDAGLTPSFSVSDDAIALICAAEAALSDGRSICPPFSSHVETVIGTGCYRSQGPV